uniref:Uncharacterized protein n=1 Tax=Strigamia maritima TaxID=126957 RepID=T1JBS5_STRMM
MMPSSIVLVVLSFPLVIFPCRASSYSLFNSKMHTALDSGVSAFIPETRFRWITVALVVSTLILGILCQNTRSGHMDPSIPQKQKRPEEIKLEQEKLHEPPIPQEPETNKIIQPKDNVKLNPVLEEKEKEKVTVEVAVQQMHTALDSGVSAFIPETRFRWITVALVVSTLILGILCQNIQLVLGIWIPQKQKRLDPPTLIQQQKKSNSIGGTTTL